MTPPIALGTGILIGMGAVAIIDRYFKPLNNAEALICSIAGIALTIISHCWGGFALGTAFAGGLLGTLLTINESNNVTTKLAVRVAFIIIFGGIGLGFQRAFI